MTTYPLGVVQACESGGALVESFGAVPVWYADRRRAIKAAGGPDLDQPRAVEVLATSPHFPKEVAA